MFEYYSTGSGIYSSGMPLAYHLTGERLTSPGGRVIIADVNLPTQDISRIEGQISHLNDLIMSNTPKIQFMILEKSAGTRYHLTASASVSLLGMLTCSIEYEFGRVEEGDTYAFAASLFPKESGEDLYYALCSLVKCSRSNCGDNLMGTSYTTTTSFTYINITGNFPSSATVIPTVLGDRLRLVNPINFILGENSLAMTNNEMNLISMNLWAKIAGDDDGDCSKVVSGATTLKINFMITTFTFMVMVIIWKLMFCI